jgi:membrane carboxypeptidase/penicillin-binding protein
VAKRRSVARRKNQGVLGNAGVFARRSFTICLIVGALGCGYLGASMWKQIQELPDVTMVERFEPIEAIQIYDKQDH